MSPDSITPLVEAVLDQFRHSTIELVDWKTCSHDRIPGLAAVLLDNGFPVDAEESVMIGEATDLADENLRSTRSQAPTDHGAR